MKKSLLALAVLGAFAGAASAQSSVTVYGIVDMGIGSNDATTTTADGRQNGIISGGQSASRIGFKGKEDLGGGLAATFQLEAGINADDGTGLSGFNRVSTVGLQGAFGAVNLGRQTTVLKNAHDQIDPFGAAGVLGNVERIFYNGQNPDGGRSSNLIKYSTNSYSGFKAQASYKFGEARDDNSAGRAYGLGLGYANGPLNVQFAYTDNELSTGATPAIADAKFKVAFLGATYNFGAFKLHGAYADNKVEQPGLKNKYRNGLIGVSVPVGPGSILASYAINQDRTAGVNEGDSKQASIAYTHDLSKRTNLYVGYAHTSNDDNAALGGGGIKVNNLVAGESVSSFAVGIRHKF